MNIPLRFTELFQQNSIVELFFVFFLLIFMLKLDVPFRDQENYKIYLFSTVQIWVLSVVAVFVDILPLGSGSVDPHIFFGSGSGS